MSDYVLKRIELRQKRGYRVTGLKQGYTIANRERAAEAASTGGVISQYKRENLRYKGALLAVQKWLASGPGGTYEDIIGAVDRALGVTSDGTRISSSGRALRPAEIRSRKK